MHPIGHPRTNYFYSYDILVFTNYCFKRITGYKHLNYQFIVLKLNSLNLDLSLSLIDIILNLLNLKLDKSFIMKLVLVGRSSDLHISICDFRVLASKFKSLLYSRQLPSFDFLSVPVVDQALSIHFP